MRYLTLLLFLVALPACQMVRDTKAFFDESVKPVAEKVGAIAADVKSVTGEIKAFVGEVNAQMKAAQPAPGEAPMSPWLGAALGLVGAVATFAKKYGLLALFHTAGRKVAGPSKEDVAAMEAATAAKPTMP